MIPVTPNWRTLYHSALLETNQNRVPKRVQKAEQAVLARESEVIDNNADSEEKEYLEYALYVLRAYKNAWQHTEAA